ncbi:MAG: hypothetical protein WBA22_19020 [Candidatus Methanofastidiosia archaeon]
MYGFVAGQLAWTQVNTDGLEMRTIGILPWLSLERTGRRGGNYVGCQGVAHLIQVLFGSPPARGTVLVATP